MQILTKHFFHSLVRRNPDKETQKHWYVCAVKLQNCPSQRDYFTHLKKEEITRNNTYSVHTAWVCTLPFDDYQTLKMKYYLDLNGM